MPELRKRYLFVLFLLTLTSMFILLYQNRIIAVPTEVDIFKIPLEIGQWNAKEISVDNAVQDILETQSVLMREYINKNGQSVWLTIVYYRDNRVELHMPERCSVGQGSQIVETGQEAIDDKATGLSMAVNKFIVKAGRMSQVVLYYFESGDFCTPSYQGLRWHMIKNKLKGSPNSGALVKFSASVKINQDETIEVIKHFIKGINLILPEYLI